MKKDDMLRGVIPALLVPYGEDGSVDHQLLEKQVEYLVSRGVQGIFVNGSTGESAYLSTQEKMEIFRTVARVARSQKGRGKEKQATQAGAHGTEGEGKRGPALCAACIQPSTEQTLEEMRAMVKLEPDYIVAVTPFYYKVDQGVILEHYRRIASECPVPVLAYDIPSCTHNKIHLETVLRLAEIPNVAGIKDSSGNFVTFCRAMAQPVKEGFSWIQGDDYLDAPSFLMGAHGIVTGTGNVFIEPYLDLYKAVQEGNRHKALECQCRINALCEVFEVVGGKVIPGIKAATYLLGRSHRWMRQVSMTLKEEEIEQVRQVLERLGLL